MNISTALFLIHRMHPQQQESTSIIVMDAGTSAVNGTYVLQSGTGTSRIWTYGSYQIKWSEPYGYCWVICEIIDEYSAPYIGNDSADPTTASWTIESGSSPIPTVIWDSPSSNTSNVNVFLRILGEFVQTGEFGEYVRNSSILYTYPDSIYSYIAYNGEKWVLYLAPFSYDKGFPAGGFSRWSFGGGEFASSENCISSVLPWEVSWSIGLNDFQQDGELLITELE